MIDSVLEGGNGKELTMTKMSWKMAQVMYLPQ